MQYVRQVNLARRPTEITKLASDEVCIQGNFEQHNNEGQCIL